MLGCRRWHHVDDSRNPCYTNLGTWRCLLQVVAPLHLRDTVKVLKEPHHCHQRRRLPNVTLLSTATGSLVLTGEISHHSHILFIGVAELVSLSISRRSRHLVVTGVVVERHHEVWCDQEKTLKMQDVGIIYLYKTSLLFQMWCQKVCVWGRSVGGTGVIVANSTKYCTTIDSTTHCSTSKRKLFHITASSTRYVPQWICAVSNPEIPTRTHPVCLNTNFWKRCKIGPCGAKYQKRKLKPSRLSCSEPNNPSNCDIIALKPWVCDYLLML